MKHKRIYALGVWLIGSLLAIALIGDSPYLGLGVAIMSGVAFGIVNWWASQ
jgi:hypothetical protein